MELYETETILRLRKATWEAKLGALFFGVMCLVYTGYLASRAHPARSMECVRSTGCELREDGKVLTRYGDIVDARLVEYTHDKHGAQRFVIELVTTTGTLREEQDHSRADADARLAPISAYARGERERVWIAYPSTWPEKLGLIVPGGALGLALLLYAVLRRGLVDLTFDRHERKVSVRASGIPGLSATWRFEDVALEADRGMEDRNGQAHYTLTLVNNNGQRVSIVRVPGGDATVAAERVKDMLSDRPTSTDSPAALVRRER